MTLDPSTIESLQRTVAKLLATSPAGQNLRLIGGFRYRLLDQSARTSHDIDYHWDGDLGRKQAELTALFERRLIPEIRRRFRFEGNVRAAAGPGDDSPNLRIVELAFWQPGGAYSRIEFPVDITRIVCLDAPAARTSQGVIYPTASDADLIESKVIALFNRIVTEHRDFCDIYLFADHFAPDAAKRLRTKFTILGIPQQIIAQRLSELRTNADYHSRQIQSVITDQLEVVAAANIQAAGGAKMVFDQVLDVLHRLKLGDAA